VVAIVLLFFGYLTIQYWRRLSKGSRPAWQTRLFTAIPLLLIAIVVIGVYRAIPKYQEYRLNNLPPPWANVPVRDYRDPEAATQAILHGLVANALPGSPFDVQELGAIRHEVTFPVPAAQWTPGMAYAARAYGRDGWGRDFRLQRLTQGRYRVSSAGADGEHGTRDDIVLVTAPTKTYDWEQLVNGVYVRRVEGEYTYFVHRIAHMHYRPRRARAAREVTGTDVFDMFRFQQRRRWGEPDNVEHPVVTELEKHRESRQLAIDADRLLFVQLSRAQDG
jgi:hypothetical protein